MPNKPYWLRQLMEAGTREKREKSLTGADIRYRPVLQGLICDSPTEAVSHWPENVLQLATITGLASNWETSQLALRVFILRVQGQTDERGAISSCERHSNNKLQLSRITPG